MATWFVTFHWTNKSNKWKQKTRSKKHLKPLPHNRIMAELILMFANSLNDVTLMYQAASQGCFHKIFTDMLIHWMWWVAAHKRYTQIIKTNKQTKKCVRKVLNFVLSLINLYSLIGLGFFLLPFGHKCITCNLVNYIAHDFQTIYASTLFRSFFHLIRLFGLERESESEFMSWILSKKMVSISIEMPSTASRRKSPDSLYARRANAIKWTSNECLHDCIMNDWSGSHVAANSENRRMRIVIGTRHRDRTTKGRTMDKKVNNFIKMIANSIYHFLIWELFSMAAKRAKKIVFMCKVEGRKKKNWLCALVICVPESIIQCFITCLVATDVNCMNAAHLSIGCTLNYRSTIKARSPCTARNHYW